MKKVVWTIIVSVLISMRAVAAGVEPADAKKTDSQPGEAKLELKTSRDRMSYALGVNVAKSFIADKLDLNLAVFFRALEDVFAGRALRLTDEQITEGVLALRQQVMANRQAALKKAAEAAKAFLAENAKKEGVKSLANGLQYKVITEGTGKSPAPTDKVKVHYRGTLLDGQEFDSSYKRGQPLEIGVNAVIKGWSEALPLMKEGSKWQLFIPPDLGYGEQGRPNIPPNSLLIFDLELLEVISGK